MNSRTAHTAQLFRAAALLFSALLLTSMMLRGSYVHEQGTLFREESIGNYGFPGLFDDFGGFFAGASLVLGILTSVQCLWSMVKDKTCFPALCVTGAALLGTMLFPMIANNVPRYLQNGIPLPLVPPLLAILMLVCAFLARKAEKKGWNPYLQGHTPKGMAFLFSTKPIVIPQKICYTKENHLLRRYFHEIHPRYLQDRRRPVLLPHHGSGAGGEAVSKPPS